jgi:hypothetical protein
MKKLHLFAAGTWCFALIAGGVLVACGDDVLVNVSPDAGDSSVPDGALPPPPPPPTDAGSDAIAFDANSASITAATFAPAVAEAVCGSLTKCCFGSNNVPDGGAVDGGGATGSWDKAACLSFYKDLGFEYSTVGALSSPSVTVDPVKAEECLAKANALSCSLTGTELASARKACFEALVGTKAAGQACARSMECGKGLFCEPTKGDAGSTAGTCKALRKTGESCDIVQTVPADDINPFNDAVSGEDACSWRGGGDTGLRCGSYSTGTGSYLSRDQWTCQPTVAVSGFCNTTVSCNNAICELPDYICRSPIDYFKGACKLFVKP